jgi:carbonic anhydrase
MSSELSTNVLLARHKSYLPSHQPFPTFAELAPLGKLPHIMVVTCADPRCIPENFLGINPGEIITIRNAGGNVQMALPNVLALDALVRLDEIMVVKHTDCGSLAYTTEGVNNVLRERAPGKKDQIEKMELGSIAGKTLEQGVKEQVAAVKASELLRAELKPKIRGFVHDLVSGELTEVEV